MDEDKQPALARKMGVLAIEKRRYPRYSVELPLDYARVEADATHGGIVANASEGGILVYLPERIETGALLRVDIFYVNGLELTTVSAVAKVVWSDLAAREDLGRVSIRTRVQGNRRSEFQPPDESLEGCEQVAVGTSTLPSPVRPSQASPGGK